MTVKVKKNKLLKYLFKYEKPQACARGVLDIFSNYLSSLK